MNIESFKEFTQTLLNEELTNDILEISKSNRLIFNINYIRKIFPQLLTKIIEEPLLSLPMLHDELKESKIYINLIERYFRNSVSLINFNDLYFGFNGSFGKYECNPRGIGSNMIGKMIQLKGIVTKTSKVRPKIKMSVHRKSELSNQMSYDPLENSLFKTGQKFEGADNEAKNQPFYQKEYRDSMTISKLAPTTTSVPKIASDQTLLILEQGMSKYDDYQSVTLQELPEYSPNGLMPVSVELILENDLVDSIVPGDRVIVSGVVKASSIHSSDIENTKIGNKVIVNFIRKMNEIKDEGLKKQIEILGNIVDKKIIDILHLSIAPSIYGYEIIKKSILLMLISTFKIPSNNSTLNSAGNENFKRSTINILLVGDPSTAKSQFLRYVIKTTPKSISTTGRGSTGVGLTAAVVRSEDVGENILSAGSLVLADGGICCIDEFDKMNPFDRVALHEAMEQQTISISKAGINATLNSRTVVFSAANPVYGIYQTSKSVSENLGIEKSLVTRFDLVWIIRDLKNKELDESIANFVLNLGKDEVYNFSKTVLTDDIENLSDGSIQDSDKNIEKFKNLSEPLKQEILKNHILRAQEMNPIITRSASKLLIDFYIQQRKNSVTYEPTKIKKKSKYLKYTNKQIEGEEKEIKLPITPRVLESLIRISKCNAKLYLKEFIDDEDANEAIKIYKESINEGDLEFKLDAKEEKKDDKIEENLDEKLISSVKKILLEFKSKGSEFVSLLDLSEKLKSFSIRDIENVLIFLDKEDIIMYSNEMALFLD